jgi:hypothetical protein
MMKQTMGKWTALLAMLAIMACSSMAAAQAGFASEFTATTGTPLGSLSEWTATYGSAGTSATVDNNMGKMSFDGLAWIYSNIRAANALNGTPKAFNPVTAGGLHFEVDVMDANDAGGGYSGNTSATIYLSTNPNWTAAGNYVSGEKLAASATWNRLTVSPGRGYEWIDSTFTISLRVVNRYATGADYWQYGADGGVVMQSFTTVPVRIYKGDRVKLAMEVRDGSGADVRVGYKTYEGPNDVWSEWTYGDWHDPTTAPDTTPSGDPCEVNYNAFSSSWTSTWANNTYFYIEGYAAKNYIVDLWIDNALVEAGPEPSVPEGDIGIFTDRFTAPDGSAINAAPHWTLAYTGAPGYDCNEIILDNMGVFEHSDLAWTYTAIRADMVFDPIVPDGLRYQFTVKKVDDLSFYTTLNGTARLCLASERGWTGAAWNESGEKFVFAGTWNRSANTVDFDLNICNNKDVPPDLDTGVNVWSISEALVDMDDGGMFDLAMELRDDSANADVRAGYRVFRPVTGVWTDWVYSGWFDPTAASLATEDSDFGADWKDRWEKNTYFYIEAYSPKGRFGRVFVDDTIVIEINKPRSCAELWLYSPQAALTGDLDQDCDVDMDDFISLLDAWLVCNDPVGIGSGCIATW